MSPPVKKKRTNVHSVYSASKLEKEGPRNANRKYIEKFGFISNKGHMTPRVHYGN